MAERVADGNLEIKLNKIGFGTGFAVGAAFYSVVLYKALTSAPTHEDALARGLLYGVFVGPLLTAALCEFTHAITTGFLNSHYLRPRR